MVFPISKVPTDSKQYQKRKTIPMSAINHPKTSQHLEKIPVPNTNEPAPKKIAPRNSQKVSRSDRSLPIPATAPHRRRRPTSPRLAGLSTVQRHPDLAVAWNDEPKHDRDRVENERTKERVSRGWEDGAEDEDPDGLTSLNPKP